MIKFVNPGAINPIAFMVMGVNAKPETNAAIGQFGTGLKYAIAIVLRLGGSIQIRTSEDAFNFDVQEVEFRDTKIQQIKCNGNVIGYTTKLGEHWEPWMAYRELYSNMVDENGALDVDPADRGWNEWTEIVVNCRQIESEFQNHWKYFLKGKPVYANTQIELHEPVDRGRIYYKGVLVNDQYVIPYNINILCQTSLTEDRTLKNKWDAEYGVAILLEQSDNEYILRKMMTVHSEDNDFMASCYLPTEFSDTAIKVAQEILKENPMKLHPRIKSKLQEKKEITYHEEQFSDVQQEKLDRAINKLLENGIEMTVPITKTTIDSPSMVAFYSSRLRKIFLADPAFNKGFQFLVTTLIEENAHALGYADYQRGFQDYILDLLYDRLD